MKAVTTILYLCGGLMAAAAVMGAIDYKVAEHKGSLKKLYKEEEQPLPIVKKTIDIEDYSRGAISYVEEEKGNKDKKEKKVIKVKQKEVDDILFEPEPDPAEKPAEEEAKPVVKEEKRIRLREFSRAPLPRKNYEGKKLTTAKATVDSAENKAWDY
jgi:hypothetical protein